MCVCKLTFRIHFCTQNSNQISTGLVMYLFTTVPHLHGRLQLKELLGTLGIFGYSGINPCGHALLLATLLTLYRCYGTFL